MFKATYRLFHRHYHQRYHGVYRNAKKLFIFDLILLGGALAMLSIGLILLFWRPDTTDLVDISL